MKNEYPKVTLSNGEMEADVFLPDAERGFYRDARFDWSGMADQIRWNGHTFLCSSEVTQNIDFRACGTAEELCMGILGTPGPLGYEEAAVGEGFLKPGVGILEKHTDEPYEFDQPHKIIEPAAWAIEHGRDWIEFSQEMPVLNGWGCRYTKRMTLSADTPKLTIFRTLENTGSQKIDSTHYCHNFLLLDDESIGPDYEIRLPFNPVIEDEELFDRVATDAGRIVFTETIPGNGGFAWGSFAGFDPAVNYSLDVVNKKTGIGIRIEGDTPMMRFHLYCQQKMICPEPFVRLTVEPNEKMHWQTTYLFQEG